MGKQSKPRAGSLQFWPRKRARKVFPRVNWAALKTENILLGFIAYKVGMISVVVKDNTPNSLTKGRNIVIPATILEVPSLKIFSVRFYNKNKVVGEFINNNIEKELKKKIKIPKKNQKDFEKYLEEMKEKGFDDIRIIVYTIMKKTNIKKTPDMIEIAIGKTLEEKINFIKENLTKEIKAIEFFKKGQLVDVRGITKGKGIEGPVKRFGIGLRQHKSEKGRRRPGSLGPWTPKHVTFRTPMAGQLGFFHRIIYNLKILDMGNIGEKDINVKGGFKHYGIIKTDYLIVSGSVMGPPKAPLLITVPLRKTKRQEKKNFEIIKIIK